MRRPGSRPTAPIRLPRPISIGWIMPARDSCSPRLAATPPRHGRKRTLSCCTLRGSRGDRGKDTKAHRRCAARHRRRRNGSGPRGLSRRSAEIGRIARLRGPSAGTGAGAGTVTACSRPAATLAVELRDFLLLERTGTRYTDLGAWIYDIDVLTIGREQDVAAAKADALADGVRGRFAVARGRADASFPGDADVAAAIAASRGIEASSPAYYTVAWHRLRLLIGENKHEEARIELDQLLDGRPLPEGVENLMRYHAMKLARDLDEFLALRAAPRRIRDVPSRPADQARRNGAAFEFDESFPCDFAQTLKWRTELFQPNPRLFR